MFYVLSLLVVASRFLPHPPNVACLGALGLFAGCYMAGRRAYLIPLGVLLVSDVIGQVLEIPGLGFYNPITMLAVYAGAVAAVPVGRLMARGAGQAGASPTWFRKAARLLGGSLAASTLFFLISNAGVFFGGWYSMSLSGLVACYTAAIPFYGYTIAGDLTYSVLLFGSWQLAHRRSALPSLLGKSVSPQG